MARFGPLLELSWAASVPLGALQAPSDLTCFLKQRDRSVVRHDRRLVSASVANGAVDERSCTNTRTHDGQVEDCFVWRVVRTSLPRLWWEVVVAACVVDRVQHRFRRIIVTMTVATSIRLCWF